MCKKFAKVGRTDLERKVFFPLCSAGKEAAHSSQNYKFLVITFEWKVHFG
jgi:hypothetical protein